MSFILSREKSQRILESLKLLELVRTMHQPHVGEALDMGPTGSLPQEEIRSSSESHVSPMRPHASRGKALPSSIPCLSSRTGCIICRA